MENLQVIFDHIKHRKDSTTLTCHVYNSKCRKVSTIMWCGMQFENGTTQILLWENLNFVMAENGVSNTNFKGFKVDNMLANCDVVMKIYGKGGPNMLVMGCDHTRLFRWSQSLDKVTHKYIKTSLQNLAQISMQGILCVMKILLFTLCPSNHLQYIMTIHELLQSLFGKSKRNLICMYLQGNHGILQLVLLMLIVILIFSKGFISINRVSHDDISTIIFKVPN